MKQNKHRVFIIIPTIRNLNFLTTWGSQFKDCHLIIVEDHQRQQIKIPKVPHNSIKHFTWLDIDQEFGKDSWIFSRKNSGLRCYGFYKAYQAKADIVITLDDDCYPIDNNFIKHHISNLNSKAPNNWFATYPDPSWMYTRGFPYKIRQQLQVVISHGLWSGALDLDAQTETKLDKLLNQKAYPIMRQFIPKNYYYPMCTMNLAFSRQAIPLMYMPMMSQDPKGNSWPYNRYEDIWAGIISKKIIDHLGLAVCNGSPFVHHKKASLPSHNLSKELSGMKMNESIWKLVDKVKLTKSSPSDCYIELANKIKFPSNSYFNKLKRAMIIWANLF